MTGDLMAFVHGHKPTATLIKENPCMFRFPLTFSVTGQIYRYGCEIKGEGRVIMSWRESQKIWVRHRCVKCPFRSVEEDPENSYFRRLEA